MNTLTTTTKIAASLDSRRFRPQTLRDAMGRGEAKKNLNLTACG
jgi:Holliday junction resolvasome RuvABC ATP-dependent DNA helicase subunit